MKTYWAGIKLITFEHSYLECQNFPDSFGSVRRKEESLLNHSLIKAVL